MSKLKVKYLYDSNNKRTGVCISERDFVFVEEKLDDYYTYRVVTEGRRNGLSYSGTRKPKDTHRFNFQFLKNSRGKTLQVFMSLDDYKEMQRKLRNWDRITKRFETKQRSQN